LAVRLLLCVLLVAVILAVGEFFFTGAASTVQTDVAVKQLQPSDASFEELRAVESGRNLLTVVEGVLVVCVVAACWAKPAFGLAGWLREKGGW